MRVGALQAQTAERLRIVECGATAEQNLVLVLEIGSRRLLEIFLEPFEPAFDDAEVGEDQFVFNRPRVAHRIDGRLRMSD